MYCGMPEIVPPFYAEGNGSMVGVLTYFRILDFQLGSQLGLYAIQLYESKTFQLVQRELELSIY